MIGDELLQIYKDVTRAHCKMMGHPSPFPAEDAAREAALAEINEVVDIEKCPSCGGRVTSMVGSPVSARCAVGCGWSAYRSVFR